MYSTKYCFRFTVYSVRRGYESESEDKRPKKIELSPRKYDGIGPVTKEGIPIVLRSVSFTIILRNSMLVLKAKVHIHTYLSKIMIIIKEINKNEWPAKKSRERPISQLINLSFEQGLFPCC